MRKRPTRLSFVALVTHAAVAALVVFPLSLELSPAHAQKTTSLHHAKATLPAAPHQKVDKQRAMAYQFATHFVERSLHMEGKVNFPLIETAAITKLSDHKYRVVGYVDTPGTLSTLSRATYTCQLHQTSPNGWKCDDLLTIHTGSRQ